jgi:hypothetical protein
MPAAQLRGRLLPIGDGRLRARAAAISRASIAYSSFRYSRQKASVIATIASYAPPIAAGTRNDFSSAI